MPCIVCGYHGWSGEKYGSHRICIGCHRLGYRFGEPKPLPRRYNLVPVISPQGNVFTQVKVCRYPTQRQQCTRVELGFNNGDDESP